MSLRAQMGAVLRRLPLAVAFALVAAGLAACGGSGGAAKGGGGPASTQRASSSARSGAVAKAPVEKRLSAAKRSALRAARTLVAARLAGSRAARKTKVVLIDVQGNRATATVRLPDGSFTGIPMAKRGGHWQLTEFPRSLFK